MTQAQQTEQPVAHNTLTFGGNPRRQYLFAYGANMNPAQMAQRCSRPVVFAIARFPGHSLGFFGYSNVWDGALETAIPNPGHDLWGVVYELSFMDGQRLDAWQDARLDGGGNYFHYPAQVVDTEGKRHTVLLYKKDVLGPVQKPSREYLELIVQGAVERGLPEDYIESMRGMESKQAGYPVPDRGDTLRELNVVSSCSDCGS